MYRRVNSSRFIVLTTAGIVLVMMVFTWVMYGMAQQVFTLTDIMLEVNKSFKDMTTDIHAMGENIQSMDANIAGMSGDIDTMRGDITKMAATLPVMTDAVVGMSAGVNRMTYDIGRMSSAFSRPMSYMWGNAFPF